MIKFYIKIIKNLYKNKLIFNKKNFFLFKNKNINSYYLILKIYFLKHFLFENDL